MSSKIRVNKEDPDEDFIDDLVKEAGSTDDNGKEIRYNLSWIAHNHPILLNEELLAETIKNTSDLYIKEELYEIANTIIKSYPYKARPLFETMIEDLHWEPNNREILLADEYTKLRNNIIDIIFHATNDKIEFPIKFTKKMMLGVYKKPCFTSHFWVGETLTKIISNNIKGPEGRGTTESIIAAQTLIDLADIPNVSETHFQYKKHAINQINHLQNSGNLPSRIESDNTLMNEFDRIITEYQDLIIDSNNDLSDKQLTEIIDNKDQLVKTEITFVTNRTQIEDKKLNRLHRINPEEVKNKDIDSVVKTLVENTTHNNNKIAHESIAKLYNLKIKNNDILIPHLNKLSRMLNRCYNIERREELMKTISHIISENPESYYEINGVIRKGHTDLNNDKITSAMLDMWVKISSEENITLETNDIDIVVEHLIEKDKFRTDCLSICSNVIKNQEEGVRKAIEGIRKTIQVKQNNSELDSVMYINGIKVDKLNSRKKSILYEFDIHSLIYLIITDGKWPFTDSKLPKPIGYFKVNIFDREYVSIYKTFKSNLTKSKVKEDSQKKLRHIYDLKFSQMLSDKNTYRHEEVIEYDKDELFKAIDNVDNEIAIEAADTFHRIAITDSTTLEDIHKDIADHIQSEEREPVLNNLMNCLLTLYKNEVITANKLYNVIKDIDFSNATNNKFKFTIIECWTEVSQKDKNISEAELNDMVSNLKDTSPQIRMQTINLLTKELKSKHSHNPIALTGFRWLIKNKENVEMKVIDNTLNSMLTLRSTDQNMTELLTEHEIIDILKNTQHEYRYKGHRRTIEEIIAPTKY